MLLQLKKNMIDRPSYIFDFVTDMKGSLKQIHTCYHLISWKRKFQDKVYFTGCITAEELKFVLTHLPGKVTYKEIDEMIKTVDENGDGKINYQEFR